MINGTEEMIGMTFQSGNYTIDFDVDAVGYYASEVSNKVLAITIKDLAGMIQQEVTLPDYKAYEFYNALETMTIVEDCDLGTVGIKTIELPPEQETRKTIILNRYVDNPVMMTILETNMINASHISRDYYLDINDPKLQEILGFLYWCFELCATSAGFPPNYYYEHINEFFDR